MDRFFVINTPEFEQERREIIVGPEDDLTDWAAGDVHKEINSEFESLMDEVGVDCIPETENVYSFLATKEGEVKRVLLSKGWRQGLVQPGMY